MKRPFVLFGVLLMALAVATAQTAAPELEVRERPVSADEADIRQISEDWIRFYNAGDAAKVAALYMEDGYYLSAHILAHGRPAIQAYWERGIRAGGHIDFIKPLTLYYTGDLAYCAGTYQATNAGVTVDGRILIVLRKVNGKWLIAAHETVVRDQPL
jgi:ketosteroid isomerase-like protein